MSFYKLEAAYKYAASPAQLAAGRKTISKIYKYHYRSFDSAIPQIKYDLSLGAKISIKEICENEYMKGTR